MPEVPEVPCCFEKDKSYNLTTAAAKRVKKNKIKTAGECSELCQSHPDCRYWSWARLPIRFGKLQILGIPRNQCNLLSGTDDVPSKVDVVGLVSGTNKCRCGVPQTCKHDKDTYCGKPQTCKEDKKFYCDEPSFTNDGWPNTVRFQFMVKCKVVKDDNRTTPEEKETTIKNWCKARVTKKGDLCKFPFRYLGKWHDDCKQVGTSDVTWCPTETTLDGDAIEATSGTCE